MSKHQEFDLRRAFPVMPENCRSALLRTASSMQEDEKMKKKATVGALVLAALMLLTALAVAAEGTGLLEFLGLRPNETAVEMIEQVSAEGRGGHCSIRIDSAVTDGSVLAFDWTVENHQPETPVYMQVDDFTANGLTVWTDGTDEFDGQWLPGIFNDGTWQGATLTPIAEWLEGDTLHVEMTVGLYTPVKPVYQQAVYDPAEARAKIAEGYFVIPEGMGYVIETAEIEDGVAAAWGIPTDGYADAGFQREEMKVVFDLDLAAARATRKELTLPEPMIRDELTLAYEKGMTSPLRLELTAAVRMDGKYPQGAFAITDAQGEELSFDYDHWTFESYGRNNMDGTLDMLFDFAAVGEAGLAALSEEISLTWMPEIGEPMVLPIKIR